MITSIPNLIKEFGTMAETCRQTGKPASTK